MSELEALMLMPPKCVDLVWTYNLADCYVARATKPFLVLWTGETQIQQMRAMGFSCNSALGADGRSFNQVKWNPHVALRYKGYVEDLDLLQTVHASDIAYAKAQQRGLDKIAQERRNATVVGEAAPVSREEHLNRVRDFTDDFGTLLEDRDLRFLEDLIQSRRTYPEEMKRFERIVDRKDGMVSTFFVKRAGKSVDWDEATVVQAAKHLTSLDLDKAKAQNGKGWGGNDSKWGHWATTHFGGPQHDLAVRVARFLVGTYARKQLLGIAP